MQSNEEERTDGDVVGPAPVADDGATTGASDAANTEGSAGASDGVSENDAKDDAGGASAAKKKWVTPPDLRHTTKYYCGACSEAKSGMNNACACIFLLICFRLICTATALYVQR